MASAQSSSESINRGISNNLIAPISPIPLDSTTHRAPPFLILTRSPTDVECRSVCSHFLTSNSSTEKLSNSELVRVFWFFKNINTDTGVISTTSDEEDTNATMVNSHADAETHTNYSEILRSCFRRSYSLA